jgi:hypothetical protein
MAPIFNETVLFVFQGITQDLFPKKDVPSLDRSELKSSLAKICAEKNLRATPYFTQKILQVKKLMVPIEDAVVKI